MFNYLNPYLYIGIIAISVIFIVWGLYRYKEPTGFIKIASFLIAISTILIAVKKAQNSNLIIINNPYSNIIDIIIALTGISGLYTFYIYALWYGNQQQKRLAKLTIIPLTIFVAFVLIVLIAY